MTLRHCTLTENEAESTGAGIFNQGTLTLHDSILRDNFALQGGGAGLDNDGGLVTITRVTFDHNLADGPGGGLSNDGTMTIAHTTFVGNGSFSSAGGLSNGDTLTITDSTFVSNSAFCAGGGLANLGTLVISNTTFHDNASSSCLPIGGGGLANFGTLTLINSTIAGNRASGLGNGGGGIDNVGSATVRVANTLLAGNIRSPSNPIPDECRGTVTSLGHNLIGDPTGCTITLQPSDLTGDPGLDAFTDTGRPGNGHFPLLPTSQAIDAGNEASCPRTDQLGRRRLGPCDIGAIEFRARDDQHDEEDDQHDEENDHHDKDLAAAARAFQ